MCGRGLFFFGTRIVPEFGSTEADEETRRQKKLDTDYTDFQDSEEERRQILLKIL